MKEGTEEFIARVTTLYQEKRREAILEEVSELVDETQDEITKYLVADEIQVAHHILVSEPDWEYSEMHGGGDNPTLKQFLWWYLWDKITQGG